MNNTIFVYMTIIEPTNYSEVNQKTHKRNYITKSAPISHHEYSYQQQYKWQNTFQHHRAKKTQSW